jgi:plasmid stability protein
MRTITIRNVPDEHYRALRVRAAQNGRSMEAKLRVLIAQVQAANPPPVARPRKSPAESAAAVARLQAHFAEVFPKREPWAYIDEFIAERRAEAAREDNQS